jgi:hypothetical protein
VEPPLGSTPWSPDFLAQELELLIVTRRGGNLRTLRPIHAPALQLGWGRARDAEAVLREALARYGLEPLVIHSTSWRHAGDEIVLTYLAVVEEPCELNPNLASEPVGRRDLARGDATSPPEAIEVGQVLEHALRHLAWLLLDDRAVAEALPDWTELLVDYLPEPFRELVAGA